MTVAIRVTKPDGSVVTASSWAAWREFAPLHMRRQCAACSGEGRQEWLGVGTDGQPRWFPDVCRNCGGKGWRLP